MHGRDLSTIEIALFFCLIVLTDIGTLTNRINIQRFQEFNIVNPEVREGSAHVGRDLMSQQSHNSWALT